MAPDELHDDGLGPEFTPETEPKTSAPALELDAALGGDVNWSANRIRSLLQAKGALIHGAFAVDRGRSQEWLYTSADLDAIAPPLARIMNRYPATRAAAAGGDELAVAVGFAGFAARSYSERRAALRARAALAELTEDLEPSPAAAAAAAAPAPMPTAADVADAPEWPAEDEPPPITGRR